MPIIDESNSNYVMLPYTLTKGVTATREGLWIYNESVIYLAITGFVAKGNPDFERMVSWPDVGNRLQYREGEPAIGLMILPSGYDLIVCNTPPGVGADSMLHRLAAILFDDAKAFRVLHWCVYNLGE